MNSTAVQFINFGAAAVQLDLFCAPCQGALFSPVKHRAGKLSLQPERHARLNDKNWTAHYQFDTLPGRRGRKL